jgi:hypothetical protein
MTARAAEMTAVVLTNDELEALREEYITYFGTVATKHKLIFTQLLVGIAPPSFPPSHHSHIPSMADKCACETLTCILLAQTE